MRATFSKKLRNLAGVSAVAIMALATALPAGATIISSGSNNPLAFVWSFNTGSSILSGTGSLSVSGFNSGSLTVGITLNNNAALASERLTAFGFGIDPNATAVSFFDAQGADGGMIDASLASIPSLATVEVCAWGGVNCAGGANGGIFGGASDTFAVILTGTWGSSVDVAPIGFKYQTGYGSFEFTGGPPSGGPTPVPEPATLALFGFGLLGLGWALRRLQQDA